MSDRDPEYVMHSCKSTEISNNAAQKQLEVLSRHLSKAATQMATEDVKTLSSTNP